MCIRDRIEAGAIAAQKAFFDDRHFLAFEFARDPYYRDYNVRFSRRRQSLRRRRRGVVRPQQLRARLAAAELPIRHSDGYFVSPLQMHSTQLGLRSAAQAEDLSNLLAVDGHVREAIGHDTQQVVAGFRGRKKSRPLYRQRRLALRLGRQAAFGLSLIHI